MVLVCIAEPVDKFFLLDGSKNVSQVYFDKAKDFIKYYVQNCPYDDYAVIEYSTETKVYYLDQNSVSVLNSVIKSDGNERMSDLAILDARQALNFHLFDTGLVVNILFGQPSQLGWANIELMELLKKGKFSFDIAL